MTSQILEEARKTLELARKKAVELYLEKMKGNQFETLQEFDLCHNQHYKTAMSFIKEIKISGGEDIQENIKSKLKNVMLISFIKISTVRQHN